MQRTERDILSFYPFEPQERATYVIQMNSLNGFLATILHNVQRYPSAVKVVAVALPVILSFSMFLFGSCLLPSDHLFRAILPLIDMVFPVVCMYEITGLMKEIVDQKSRKYLL